jgi:hypothetical protein
MRAMSALDLIGEANLERVEEGGLGEQATELAQAGRRGVE